MKMRACVCSLKFAIGQIKRKLCLIMSMFDRKLLSLRACRKRVPLLVFMSVVKALLTCGWAYALAMFASKVWEGADLYGASSNLVIFLLSYIFSRVCDVLISSISLHAANESCSQLRIDLLSYLYGEGQTSYESAGLAAVSSSALSGIDAIYNYITLGLPRTINLVCATLVYLVFLVYLDPVTALIVLICIPTIVFFMVLIGSAATEKSAKKMDSFKRLQNEFLDAIRGIPTLLNFGQETHFEQNVFDASERNRTLTMGTLRTALMSSLTLDLVATLSLAAVAVMLGFRLIDGTVGLMNALAVLVCVPEAFVPIRKFAADYHANLDGKQALQKALDMLSSCPSDSNLPNIALTAHQSVETLELRDISFTYENSGGEALSNCSLSVEKGSRIVIVGKSGSGKTTLANIIAGISSPSSGEISVNGCQVHTLQCDEWFSRISYIPQHPYIFHDSLRNNLTLYAPECSDEELQQCLKLVGLSELLEEMPEGLDSILGVGERGVSGGEAQRIALCRALLADRDVIVLDEPTAHLDVETEYELKRIMETVFRDKMVFFATHRLHWLDSVDLVLELEDGKIKSFSSTEEYLNSHHLRFKEGPQQSEVSA